MTKRLEIDDFNRPNFREGYLAGIRVAASWITPWDEQLAEKVNGYRFSDMLLCKFNLTKRKRPRRVSRVARRDER